MGEPTTQRQPHFELAPEAERRRKAAELASMLRGWTHHSTESEGDEDYDILAALDENRKASGDFRRLAPPTDADAKDNGE